MSFAYKLLGHFRFSKNWGHGGQKGHIFITLFFLRNSQLSPKLCNVAWLHNCQMLAWSICYPAWGAKRSTSGQTTWPRSICKFDMRSRQVKVTKWPYVGHVAYQSMRLGETNTLAPCPALHLFSIKSYWQKRTVTLWRHNVTSDNPSRGNWWNSAPEISNIAYLVMINGMNSNMNKSMSFLKVRDSEVMSVTLCPSHSKSHVCLCHEATSWPTS